MGLGLGVVNVHPEQKHLPNQFAAWQNVLLPHRHTNSKKHPVPVRVVDGAEKRVRLELRDAPAPELPVEKRGGVGPTTKTATGRSRLEEGAPGHKRHPLVRAELQRHDTFPLIGPRLSRRLGAVTSAPSPAATAPRRRSGPRLSKHLGSGVAPSAAAEWPPRRRKVAHGAARTMNPKEQVVKRKNPKEHSTKEQTRE